MRLYDQLFVSVSEVHFDGDWEGHSGFHGAVGVSFVSTEIAHYRTG